MQYSITDDGLDVITDSMVLRLDMSPNLGGFDTCWLLSVKGWTSVATQPRMELVSRERAGHYADRTDSAGRILERCEVSQVSMVECECVLYNSKSDIYARIPTADMTSTASI